MEEFRKEPATIILVVLNVLVFLAVEFTGFSQDTVHMLDGCCLYSLYSGRGGNLPDFYQYVSAFRNRTSDKQYARAFRSGKPSGKSDREAFGLL